MQGLHVMNAFNLGDYVDVPARVKMLFERWPNARIVESLPQIRMFDGREWIEVTVTIHLGDDTVPVVASAWEPKGSTSFTRDSEMMNCSTSAVGRACGLLNLGIGKSIASRNEVQARQPGHLAEVKPIRDDVEQPFGDTIDSKQYASPKQRGMIRALAFEKKIGTTELMPYINKVLDNKYSSIEALTKQEASQVIESLQT
jgi:hypothetical protein